MSPPRIKVRGAARAKGIPQGYVLGRVSPNNGDVELLRLPDLVRLGVQSKFAPGLLEDIPAQRVLGNAGPGDGQPVPLSISDILDFLSTNQGDIIYRNATDWVVLIPGTAGQVLTTGGTAANPSWEDPAAASPVVYDDGTVPAGNTVASTAAERDITSTYVFPAGVLLLNDVVRLTLRGLVSTAGMAPTLNIRVYLNTTLIAQTGNVSLTGSISGQGWEAHVLFFVTQAGASGTIEAQGSAQLDGYQPMTNAAAISVDTTIDQQMIVSLDWDTASASNTVTVRQMLIEHMAGANPPPPPVAEFEAAMAGDEIVFVSVTNGGLEYILPGSYVTEGAV